MAATTGMRRPDGSNAGPPTNTAMNLRSITVTVLASTCLASCGGGSDPPSPVTFAFRVHGLPASEEFRATISSPEVIARARAQLQRPQSERLLFANGAISPGNGGHNLRWSWHFGSVDLVDSAIELCDGRPSMVEANLDYWLNTVGRFCPWASFVHAEIP